MIRNILYGGLEYGNIGKIAFMTIIGTLVISIIEIAKLHARYRRLRHSSAFLLKQIQETGADAALPEGTQVPLEIIEEIRCDSKAKKPLASSLLLGHAFDILAEPFLDMVRNMHILGWIAYLAGLIGGLIEILNANNVIILFYPSSMAFADTLREVAQGTFRGLFILFIGLVIGSSSLLVSVIYRSLLSKLRRNYPAPLKEIQ